MKRHLDHGVRVALGSDVGAGTSLSLFSEGHFARSASRSNRMDSRAHGQGPGQRLTQWPYLRMILMTAAGFAGFFVTLASLPAWIVSQGRSTASAGACTTVMLAATVLFQPAVPYLLRKLPTATTVTIGLVALGLPAPLLIWVHSGPSLYGICAVRGAGFAVFTVAGTFMTSEIAPPGKQGEVTGLYGLAAAIPNIIMIPLSILLLHQVGFWPIALIASLPLLGSTLGLGGGRRRDAHATTEREVLAGTRSAIARTMAPASVLCAVTIAGGAIITILPIERATGYVATTGLLLYGIAGALTRWQAGLRADRHGVASLLVLSCLVAVAGIVALAAGLTSGSDPVTLLSCTVVGAAYGAVQCLTLVSAFARTGGHNRATASAVWNAAFDAGTAIGAALIGEVTATSLGLWGGFAVLAALVAATMPAAVASGRPTASTETARR